MKKTFLLIFSFFIGLYIYAQQLPYLQELNEKYTSGFFKSSNAHVLVPMDDVSATSAINIFQYMQGRIPGLSIYQNSFQRPVVTYRWGVPTFFLNEQRVDASALTNVIMDDIAMVKIFRPPFIGAIGGGANGAIAVYTKEGEETEEEENE